MNDRQQAEYVMSVLHLQKAIFGLPMTLSINLCFFYWWFISTKLHVRTIERHQGHVLQFAIITDNGTYIVYCMIHRLSVESTHTSTWHGCSDSHTETIRLKWAVIVSQWYITAVVDTCSMKICKTADVMCRGLRLRVEGGSVRVWSINIPYHTQGLVCTSSCIKY